MKVPKNMPTKRLTLRWHSDSDLPAFVRFMTDGDSTRYMPFEESQKSPEGASEMLSWVMSAYESDSPIFSLTISLRGSEDYLGSCGLHPYEDIPGVMEMYYTLLPDARGNGYATEAADALVHHAFEILCISKIVARIFSKNVPSVSVLDRLGFQDDSELPNDGRLYALTRQQWEGRRFA